jgi:DHA1 family bicyclomycin/chloramphenicol resistance-like MFS transporter
MGAGVMAAAPSCATCTHPNWKGPGHVQGPLRPGRDCLPERARGRPGVRPGSAGARHLRAGRVRRGSRWLLAGASKKPWPPQPPALRPAVLLRTWAPSCATPPSWAWSALSTASYGGLFTFLAASSFVLIEVLGVSHDPIRAGDVSMSSCYMGWAPSVPAAAGACGRAPHGGAGRLRITLQAARCWACCLAGPVVHPVAAIIHGPLLPVHAGARRAPALRPERAVGPVPAGGRRGIGPQWVDDPCWPPSAWAPGSGWRLDGTVFPLTQGIWFWSACIALTAWTLVQRYGDKPQRPPDTRQHPRFFA